MARHIQLTSNRKLAISLQSKEKILQLLLCSIVMQNYWVGIFKNGRDLLDQETLKLSVSHKWFDELCRLIEWFLYADSDWIAFGWTTNLFYVLDIFWVSAAIVLVKMMFCFYSPQEYFQNLVFPNAFNRSLIKCGKIVSYLMQYLKKNGKWPET